MVGAGYMNRVSTAGADAEDADAVRIDAGEHAECVDRVRDVFAAPVRILEVAGFAAALPLVGGIEDKRRDAPGGEARGVFRATCSLTLLPGVDRTTARCGLVPSKPSGWYRSAASSIVPRGTERC
jgi:hypothetical protein